jgi:peroxiredoxin (alkyl hydroperoxide reductase subunit C)
MKPTIKILIALVLLSGSAFSQESQEVRIPLLGDPAPEFTAESTRGTLNFPADYFQKWKILFSHPGDFTPVCSTEILELAAMQEDFDKLGAKLVVMSTDGLHSHMEWVKSLESIKYHDKGPFKINFPLVSDPTLEISKKYGMINPKSVNTKDVRGVYIIDPDNKIQAMFFYPPMTGRNIDEIKRTLVALQMHESKNVLTPADWEPGDAVLIPSPSSVQDAEKLAKKNDPDLYSLTWYLWFKKMP